MNISIDASSPHPSADMDGACDVDVAIYSGGETLADGEVTLLRDHDHEWSSWGTTLDMWASGDLVRWIGSLQTSEQRSVADAMERAARTSIQRLDRATIRCGVTA